MLFSPVLVRVRLGCCNKEASNNSVDERTQKLIYLLCNFLVNIPSQPECLLNADILEPRFLPS